MKTIQIPEELLKYLQDYLEVEIRTTHLHLGDAYFYEYTDEELSGIKQALDKLTKIKYYLDKHS